MVLDRGRASERCRRLLAAELGADPAREIQLLYLEVRRAGCAGPVWAGPWGSW